MIICIIFNSLSVQLEIWITYWMQLKQFNIPFTISVIQTEIFREITPLFQTICLNNHPTNKYGQFNRLILWWTGGEKLPAIAQQMNSIRSKSVPLSLKSHFIRICCLSKTLFNWNTLLCGIHQISTAKSINNTHTHRIPIKIENRIVIVVANSI